MRNIIGIALILTALSLQAQVVPNATNADNLGGSPATNYMTLGEADYLPKSSGTVIDQNVADIATVAESTGTVPKPVTLVVGFTNDCDYICSGTNDHIQLQQALNTVPIGGTVKLREGRFSCSLAGTNLTTAVSSTTIMGMGDSTVLSLDVGNDLLHIDHTNFKLMNLAITCTTGNGQHIIQVNKSNCLIQNCWWNELAGNHSSCIDINAGADNCFVIGNRLIDTDGPYAEALITVDGDNCIVTNNYINTVGDGVKGTSGDNNTIEGNRIIASGSGRKGINISNANCDNWMIHGNNFQDCTAEITDSGTGTQIRNNTDKNGVWLPEVLTDLIADATEQNKVEIDDNKAVIEELSASTLVLYYTNEVSPSSGYLLMTDTIPAGAESTVVSAMSASTVIVTSFTVETVLGLSALRKGLYHSHFHAEMNNTNRDVRLRFEVWNGTGTGETFLFSSEQSNLMTADKTAYDIHVSTDEIITTVNYPAIRIVADVTGAAAAPILTFYMEGDNSSAFEMPALLSDVGVTKIIAGTNMNVSPTDGRGEVTANVDDPPTFGTMNIGSFVYHDGDTNTFWVFSTDNLKLVAGGLTGIEISEGTIDRLFIGDGPFDYMHFGDTTNAMVEISSYVYATQLWRLRNLEVFYGGQFSTITVLGKATIQEMELRDGTTIPGKLKVRQITSGDAGSADDVYTRFPSSDSWGEPPAGGGAGEAGFTTYYLQLGGFMSDIYKSTSVPVDMVSVPSSWTITGLQAFSLYGSTCASVIFEVMTATGTNTTDPIVWTSVSTIEISTATTKSGWTSASTDVDMDKFVGLFVNFVSPIGGDLNVGAGVTIKYHRKE